VEREDSKAGLRVLKNKRENSGLRRTLREDQRIHGGKPTWIKRRSNTRGKKSRKPTEEKKAGARAARRKKNTELSKRVATLKLDLEREILGREEKRNEKKGSKSQPGKRAYLRNLERVPYKGGLNYGEIKARALIEKKNERENETSHKRHPNRKNTLMQAVAGALRE